jgi:hypothetical protein
MKETPFSDPANPDAIMVEEKDPANLSGINEREGEEVD